MTVTPSPSALSGQVLLDALFEQTPLGVAFLDTELRFVRVNQVLARMNGATVDDHLGRTVHEVVPTLAPTVEEIAAELQRTRAPLRKELRGETPAQPGVTRAWAEQWFPVIEHDLVTGYGVTVEEITDRLLADRQRDEYTAALQKSEERLQFTLRTGGVVIWEYDPQRDLTVWTGDTQGVYGYPLEGMPTSGPEYRRVLHPDDAARVMQEFERAMRSDTDMRQDFRVVWPDGRAQWVHARASFTRDAQGTVMRVTGINSNVTERHVAEEALRQSEERLRLSMEAAYLIGFSWDIVRDEVHRLHSGSASLPETSIEAPARFADVVARVHVDDKALFEANVRRAFDDPAGRYESEFRVVEPDGRVRWLYERGAVRRDMDGRPVALSGLSQDISARKSAEDALRLANQRKDEFLATLAHELRNPLAPIRSATEVLRLLELDHPTLHRAVGVIDRQVTQMVRLVDDLLDVNRITRGDVTLHKATVDIAHVVHAAVETSRPLIDASQHTLQLQLPDSAAFVDADPARLAQALSNLLNNAARYTSPGGVIAVRVETDEGRVVIRVTDNGCGIAADRLQDVFEMFTRAAPGDAKGGLGIGLALVRRIVQMHGGDVRAASAGIGQGSTFECWLPLSETRPLVIVPDDPADREVAGLRILIVDDNVDFALSEATMLELRQHVVCVVHGAQAALDVAPVFTPDVALLDIGLPGMDGYELAARLRRDPSLPDLVLVAQTGWGQPTDRERAFSVGFDAHLTKPVDWEALQRVLARVRRRVLRERAQASV